MVIVFVLVALLVLAVLVTGNWYLWRRLFRDTTGAPGTVRRIGAVVIAGGWALTFAAFFATRSGLPFWLKQVLAWPGYLWLALCLYLLLAVLAGEAVRPVLRRVLERRAGRTTTATPPDQEPKQEPEPEPASIPAGTTAAETTPAAPAAPGTSQPADADTPAPTGTTPPAPAARTPEDPAAAAGPRGPPRPGVVSPGFGRGARAARRGPG
ncbi:metallophosphoesterase, partial [Streptomyces prasinus]